MNCWLTSRAKMMGGWKVPFTVVCSRPEKWISDYYKKAEFVLSK